MLLCAAAEGLIAMKKIAEALQVLDRIEQEGRCGGVNTDDPGRPTLPTRLMAGLAKRGGPVAVMSATCATFFVRGRSSIVALKQSAVIGPTLGTVVNLQTCAS